jgi:chromosomal replication initiation ATPase DnaA
MKPALTAERVSRAADYTAKVFEVPQCEILGRNRIPSVARARQAMYAALYDGCQTSYTEMAWRLNRDHSTLIYGVKRARAMAEDDNDYAVALARVCAVVRYGY